MQVDEIVESLAHRLVQALTDERNSRMLAEPARTSARARAACVVVHARAAPHPQFEMTARRA
jgi:hypothetical protein